MARSRWSRRLRLGYGLRHQNPPLSCAGKGKTIVAGYPWFTDWGRDTFISLRGLCLTTDRLDDARDILLEWAGVVSQGMLPNRFPDLGDEPKYNSVDASLWYIIAVYHQGTVWPWLIGAFVEAWLRVRAGTLDAKGQARQRFLSPLMEHLDSAGLGHVSEIADADPPHTARGCSFQAWSLGELLWLNRVVLADAAMARKSCIEPA